MTPWLWDSGLATFVAPRNDGLAKRAGQATCSGRAFRILLGRRRQPVAAAADRGTPVADNLTDVIEELCVANRILSHEGVLDAFGHVPVRHPTDPEPLSAGALAFTASDRARRSVGIQAQFRAGEAAPSVRLYSSG